MMAVMIVRHLVFAFHLFAINMPQPIIIPTQEMEMVKHELQSVWEAHLIVMLGFGLWAIGIVNGQLTIR